MITILRSLILGVAALFLFASCGSPNDARREVDFFDPRELDHYDETIPSGERPAENYPWAATDKPVYFHTLEESEATRDEWQTLYERVEEYPGRAKNAAWGWEIKVRLFRDWDEQLEDINVFSLRERGAFYGIPSPLNDSHLHMFECTGDASDAVYLVGEALVECQGEEGMNILVRTASPLPDDGRSIHEPQVGPRWYAWWEEMLAHAERAWHGPGTPNWRGDPGKYMDTILYVYGDGGAIGLRAQRKLALIQWSPSSVQPDPSDTRYSGPTTIVPTEFCTIELNFENMCSGR